MVYDGPLEAIWPLSHYMMSVRRLPGIDVRMTHTLAAVSRALAGSSAHTFALYLLNHVPGFPPIVQTVHLLSVSAVMGSIVLIDLRMLGLALPSQSAGELVRRLMPWTWWALPCLAMSGLVFILARPNRYMMNPVFGLKFAMLVPAVILGVVFQRASAKDAHFWERSGWTHVAAKIIACVSLLLWIGVAMAGRWIAYADYLFPP
jgi:hypothetical protein